MAENYLHGDDAIWNTIREETAIEAAGEPILASFLHAPILNHDSMAAALEMHLERRD